MAIIDTVEVVFKIVYSQFTSAMNEMNRVISQQEKVYKTLSGTIDDTNDSIAKIGLATAGFAKALSIALYEPLKAAMDFEKGFARLKRLVDDTSEIGKFEDAMKNIISTVPLASKELLHFGEEALKAGANSVESFKDLTRLGAELQANVGGPVGSLLTQMIRFTKVFGEGNEQVRNTVDITTKLANAFSTTEPEILKVATRFAPMAKAVGFTKEQTLALANATKEVGATSEAAGTVYTQFFTKVQEGLGGNTELLHAFGKITGKTAEQFARDFIAGPEKATLQFMEALQKSVTEGKSITSVLKTLGLEGARQAIIFGQMAGTTDVFRKSIEKAEEAVDKTKKTSGQAVQIWQNTTAELQILRNNVELLAIAIGKGMNREVGMTAQMITYLTDQINDNPIFNNTAAQAIITFTANTLAMVGAFTILTTMLRALGTSWTAMALLMFVSAPYAAAIAGIIGIITYWKEFIYVLSQAAKIVGVNFDEMINGINNTGNVLIKAGKAAYEWSVVTINAIIEADKSMYKWQLNLLSYLGLTETFFDKSYASLKKFGQEMLLQLTPLGNMVKLLEILGKLGPSGPDMQVLKPVATAEFETRPPWELPPDEAIAKINEELNNALKALDIKSKYAGTKLQHLKDELALFETAYQKFVKIIPLPEDDIKRVAEAIGFLQKKIEGFKEEKKLDKIEESIYNKLNTANIIGAFFGEEVDSLRQQVELTRSAIVEKIKFETKKLNVGEAKEIWDVSVINSILHENEELKELDKTYADLNKRLGEAEKIEGKLTAIRTYSAKVLELESSSSLGIITQLEKQNSLREAALTLMLKYRQLKDTTSEGYIRAQYDAKDAALNITDLTIKGKGEVELQKLKNKVYEEATTIVGGVNAAQTKYEARLEALKYAQQNLGLSTKDYNSLLDETRLQYVKSTETFKESEQAFNAVGSAAVSAFEEMLESGKFTAEGLKGVAKTILQTLGKIVAQAIATKIVLTLLGSSGNILGGSTGAPSSFTGGGMTSFSNMPALQGGGLVSKTGAYMLHSPEAVVPIEGGAIPVELSGMNEQMQNITIINVADMSTAQSVAQDKNAIINVISRNIEERGPVYRSIKLAGSKG